MSATEQLAQNLQETADFLHVQKSVLDQPTWKMVVEQQTSVMLRRLELLNTLSPGEATAIVKLVTESKLGEIDPQWRSKAVLAVGARVSHGGKATTAARPKQAMSNWSSYLSVKDVELLQSANLSNYAKLDVVANRMVRIGLDLPTESSAGVALGNNKQSLELLQTLKCLMRSKARKAGKKSMEHIETYPYKPSQALIAVAYDADDPPCEITSPVAGRISCLRKTAKGVKEDSPPSTELVPAPAQPATNAVDANPMGFGREAMQMFQMFQMFQSLQGGGSGAGSSNAGSPSAGNGANLLTNLQVFGNKGNVTMTPSPANRLTAEPPASAAKAATIAAGESQTDSQEQSPKGLELVLPLTKQVISPEEQLSLVKTATAERQAAKEEAKRAEAAAEQVFLNTGDRCDKKVKIQDEENCGAEWQRALQLIDEAPEDVE
ncbi:unnamed protein product [Durusdinium trenchii]|uniref:Uncharacterized protein n=1 Tax=Durusdinium trenchii TaxID=1381693 RepID=A0ABP0IE80_9DINO